MYSCHTISKYHHVNILVCGKIKQQHHRNITSRKKSHHITLQPERNPNHLNQLLNSQV
jgi:hypothetical protein